MFGRIKEALSLERWIENFEGYLDARIELAKYDIREALVGILIKVVFFGALAFFVFLAMVCLNFGLAFWLNGLLGNPYAGFFVLTGIYLLTGSLIFMNRNNQAVLNYFDGVFRVALNQPKKSDSEQAEKPTQENN
jgi:hypothetical protein